MHRNTVARHKRAHGLLGPDVIARITRDQQEDGWGSGGESDGSGESLDSAAHSEMLQRLGNEYMELFQDMDFGEFIRDDTSSGDGGDGDGGVPSRGSSADDEEDPDWRGREDEEAENLKEVTRDWIGQYLRDRDENNHTTDIVTCILETSTRNNSTQTSTDDMLSTLAHKVLPLALKMSGMDVDESEVLAAFPDNHQQAVRILKDFILEPVQVHFCVQPGCRQIWRDVKVYNNDKACPSCRNAIDRKATAVLRYFPMKEVFQGLFRHPILSQYFTCHAQHETQEGVYRSVWGENRPSWLVQYPTRTLGTPRYTLETPPLHARYTPVTALPPPYMMYIVSNPKYLLCIHLN